MSSQGLKRFLTLLKLAVRPNSKTPVFIKWNKKEQHREFRNSKIYNKAISTGSINNLRSLDIDNKNYIRKY